MSAVEGEESVVAGVGERLAQARVAAGLTIADLVATTRISARHLHLIEAGDFLALPGRSYAIGFARSFARAVGEDEKRVVADVSAAYAAAVPQDDALAAPTFTPGDPARVPSSRFAWGAAAALLVAVVGGFVWWQNSHSASGALPSLLPAETPAAVVPIPAPQPVPSEVASTEPDVTPDAAPTVSAVVPVAAPSASPTAVASRKPVAKPHARPAAGGVHGDSEAAAAQRAFNAQSAASANPSTVTQ